MSYKQPLISELPGDKDLEAGIHDDEYAYSSKYVNQFEAHIRLGFIRKVYGLVSMQLLVSTGFVFLCVTNPAVKAFVAASRALLIVAAIVPLFIICASPAVFRKYPTNMCLLAVFTVCESYVLGSICTMYNPQVVLQAVILTALITVGLTLYTMNSKTDFSGMGPYLFAILLVFVIGGFLRMLFPYSRTFETVYAACGALLFSLYIIYDTHQIMNKLSPDDYIFAAINLYLDIINLFLEILKLLSKD